MVTLQIWAAQVSALALHIANTFLLDEPNGSVHIYSDQLFRHPTLLGVDTVLVTFALNLPAVVVPGPTFPFPLSPFAIRASPE